LCEGAADVGAVGSRTVECLRCGDTRLVSGRDEGECERCEYVGWALVADLTEKLRRVLRERPPERRRLYAA
jgi:ribosomal protein S27AE